jgi:hypothetical protein
MCVKCVEIDKNIERCRRIQLAIGDLATVDRTKQLIADLKLQKAALHPDQTDRGSGQACRSDASACGWPLDFQPY